MHAGKIGEKLELCSNSNNFQLIPILAAYIEHCYNGVVVLSDLFYLHFTVKLKAIFQEANYYLALYQTTIIMLFFHCLSHQLITTPLIIVCTVPIH